MNQMSCDGPSPIYPHLPSHIQLPQTFHTGVTIVNSIFVIKDTTFSRCSTCIVLISQLPKEVRKYMNYFNIHMKEINGSITVLGELNSDIIIGNHNSPVFKEINVLVTAQVELILISQNTLGHDALNSYSINNHNATVVFRRTLTLGHTSILRLPLHLYHPC